MKKNSLVEGAVIATVALFVVKILGLLYVIPFYNIIGEQGGALYSYAYNIYAIFLGISSTGIPSAINKIVSEYNALNKNEAKYRTLKISKIILSIISIIAFVIMFAFAKPIATAIIGNLDTLNSVDNVAFVIRAISFALLIIPYLSATRGYFLGQNIIKPSSMANIIEQVIRIAIIIFGSYISYKVFHLSLPVTVAIALSGATIGGLGASLYLKIKSSRHKKEIGMVEYEKKDDVKNKTIVKKIFNYSIPFIIISIATNIYNFVDLILIMRGLKVVGYSGPEIEFIQSALTTWSNKICIIITSFTIGMGTSLIPSIVANHTKGDIKKVEHNFIKAILIVMAISLPVATGINLLSNEIWSIFYGYNSYGVDILKLTVISTLIANVYSLVQNTIIALNKFKLVYLSSFIGLLINSVLDIPMILLLNNIGIKPYYGTIIATIIGYSVSILISCYNLRKTLNISYKPLFIPLLKMLLCNGIMILGLKLMDYLPISNVFIKIISYAVCGALIYFVFMHLTKNMQAILGDNYLDRIKNKFRRKKDA